MLIVNLFAILAAASYFILIAYFIIEWVRNKEFFSEVKSISTFASIIIPVRNEAQHIEQILTALAQQSFSKNLYEVIVVDDSSEDDTKKKIENACPDKCGGKWEMNLKIIQNAFQGKKGAIATGIGQAKGNLIITTDADCRMEQHWLSTIVTFYEQEKPEMIIAPVCISSNNAGSLWGALQSLEFLSLSAVTASSALAGNPLMCSGANLAYTKKGFAEVNGFEGFEKTPSGDDVLLMHKFKKKFPRKIKYLKAREAIVYTEPQKNISSFIHQRKRWLSKNKYYNDFSIIFTAWLVLFINFFIALYAILSLVNKDFAEILFISIGIKFFIDFLFLFLTASFFRQKALLWLYMPLQALYVFYVPLIAWVGWKGNFVWKGRGH